LDWFENLDNADVASEKILLMLSACFNKDPDAEVQITTFPDRTESNKACIWRVGFCGIFRHFLRLEFFLLPSRIHVRPNK